MNPVNIVATMNPDYIIATLALYIIVTFNTIVAFDSLGFPADVITLDVSEEYLWRSSLPHRRIL
jgi:heme/copper-type cytochrome/quinol oxidase subunit 2